MEPVRFRYVAECSEIGCERPAVYKVAAAWSDGTSQELKTYGLACADHAESQASRARSRRALLRLEEGETVGDVRVYRLTAGRLELVPESIDGDRRNHHAP